MLFRFVVAVVSVLVIPAVSLAKTGAEDGREAFVRLGCGGCHAVTRTPLATIAERAAQKGPDLWYAGSKFRRQWLQKWLQAPTPILGVRYDSLPPDPNVSPHPRVPEGEAKAVTAYLMSLKDPQMRTGVIRTDLPASRMVMLEGRMLFGKEQQCFACHKTRTRYGVEIGGVTAPTLDEAGRRLNPDWIFAFLVDQKRYVPVGRMPVYRGETYTDYDVQKLTKLARYLAEMGREESK